MRSWRPASLPEAEQVAVALHPAPVEPADVVVLAVRVVVALLGAAYLVAHEDHGHALRQHQDGGEVLDLAVAQRVNGGIVGRPLGAAVPRKVVVVAVAVALAVGLVVLAVVGHQVVEGEAVVAGDEVDAVAGHALLPLVEVGAAGEAPGEIAGLPRVAPDEAANRVAVAAVPLRPAEAGEIADLVQ